MLEKSKTSSASKSTRIFPANSISQIVVKRAEIANFPIPRNLQKAKGIKRRSAKISQKVHANTPITVTLLMAPKNSGILDNHN